MAKNTPNALEVADKLDHLASHLVSDREAVQQAAELIRAQHAALAGHHISTPNSAATAIEERAAFEAWCITQGWVKAPTARDNGSYVNGSLQARWLGWQGRASIAAEDKDAAWHNFNLIQYFEGWLIEQGHCIVNHTEEKDGEHAVVLNWIASIKAMIHSAAPPTINASGEV